MSLYSDYIKERTNRSMIETDDGFVIYFYPNPQTVYIEDIYVVPSKRKSHLASEMADLVVKEAKEKGCNVLIGSVAPSAKNSTASVKVLLAYGMELDSSQNDFIVFKKGI